MTAVAERPHIVYVMRGRDGAPLYIGSTSNLTNRVRQHRNAAPWFADVALVEVESQHDSKPTACLREAELIDTLHPLHNRKSGNRRLWTYYAQHGYPTDEGDDDALVDAAVDRMLSKASQ